MVGIAREGLENKAESGLVFLWLNGLILFIRAKR